MVRDNFDEKFHPARGVINEETAGPRVLTHALRRIPVLSARERTYLIRYPCDKLLELPLTDYNYTWNEIPTQWMRSTHSVSRLILSPFCIFTRSHQCTRKRRDFVCIRGKILWRNKHAVREDPVINTKAPRERNEKENEE